jgi:FlaA1/EpsC-like NDP-sugar epimerase
MIGLSWYLAYWLRFNLGAIPNVFLVEAATLLPLVIICHLGTSVILGVPRGAWRFTSIYDLTRVTQAVVFGTAIVAALVFTYDRMWAVPRSVFLLQTLLLLGLLAGPRILYRIWHDRETRQDIDVGTERVLIVGAGTAAEMLIRDLMRATPRRYAPVALVDDDPRKQGRELHGVRVVGGCNTIPLLTGKLGISRILLAMPSATAAQMRTAVGWCEKAQLPFRTLPKVQDIIDGTASSQDLREVDLDDLLGRKPVTLDWGSISSGLKGKRVVVTGGGGSIGSELCRQLVRLRPAKLILIDQGEFNLYSIASELAESGNEVDVLPLLADVCDESAMRYIFSTHKPEIVFHAAAYKHVPLLQDQARETVRNNVMGTCVVAEASIATGCETFVLISTDKAVNPTSLMGASKRMAEIVCQVMDQESATRFVTVRFGNVLGSAGSVVPLFRKQIEGGGPVTVTHPDMTRYFMTMAEACQLILQASVEGIGQAIYVLNMGEPVKISDLAEQMIRLAGLRTDNDIRIEFTGLRPGEKLKEELFHDLESLAPTGFEKLLLADKREVDRERVLDGYRQLVDACNDYDYQTVVRVMRCLVPEYREATNDTSEGATVQATERGKGELQGIKSPAGTTGDLRTEPVESRRS